jgi:hypothetical protein
LSLLTAEHLFHTTGAHDPLRGERLCNYGNKEGQSTGLGSSEWGSLCNQVHRMPAFLFHTRGEKSSNRS